VAEWVFPLQNRILPPEKTYAGDLNKMKGAGESESPFSAMARRHAEDRQLLAGAPQRSPRAVWRTPRTPPFRGPERSQAAVAGGASRHSTGSACR